MSWVLDNLQIVVALAAGVAYWLNNMREAKESREQDAPPVDAEDIFGPDFDFGEPEPTAPTPPPLPVTDNYESLRQQQLQDRIRIVRENKASNRSSTEVSRTWQQKKDHPKRVEAFPNSIKSRLRTPVEIRKAFIMREILGPPTGLR